MKALVGIFGASGFAKEVLPVVRQHLARANNGGSGVVFVDRDAGESVDGVAVISESDFLCDETSRFFVLAIADSRLRQRLHETATASGAKSLSIRANSAEVLGTVELGAGAILCSNTILTSNIRVGRGLHLNLNSYIAHDCNIGNWVTFGPNVACNGNVIVEDHVYIGAGAMIRQGTPKKPLVIGAGAVIGMGAVVTKSVPPGITVIGNPARPLDKNLVS